MRKRILIGIAVGATAIAAVAAPPVIGSITRHELGRVHTRVTEQSPFIHAWEMTAFDQGYLGATATSELTVGAPDDDERMTIVLEHRIRHAPAAGADLAHVRTEPRLSEGPLRTAIRSLYGDDRTPLRVDTRVAFDGTRTVDIHSPATDGMRSLEAGRVDWRGLDATVTVGRGEQSLRYDLSMPGLHLQPRTGEIDGARIEGVRADGAYEATAFEDVWTGGAAGAIDRIELRTADDGAITLTELTFSDRARLTDDLFGFAVEATAETLETPDYAFSAIRLGIRGERIAPAFLQALQQARGDGDDVMARLNEAPWNEIAAHEPLLRLESFRAETPDGALAVSARAGLHTPGESDREIGTRDLMGLAHGEIDAAAPEAMVIDAVARSIAMREDTDPQTARRNATNTLRTLAAQGLLTISDGRIEANAGYERGAITINGTPLFGG